MRCGEAPNTPVLDDLFLVGATQQDVGLKVGSDMHKHEFSGQTGDETHGRLVDDVKDSADNWGNEGERNWDHKHDFRGTTKPTGHVPPALKVLFLCKAP